MTIIEFENQAVDLIKDHDERVVDIYSWEVDEDYIEYSYMASILAIKEHIVYRYAAYGTVNGRVKVTFSGILN